MQATLLLLAGGEGRRMGRPKETLPWAGSTLIEAAIDRLGPAFVEVLVATAMPGRLPPRLGARVVLDQRPGGGPLAGLEAGLAASAHDTVMTLACDLPHVDLALVTALLDRLGGHDAAVPFVGGRPDPLCAVYHRRVLGTLRRLLGGSADPGPAGSSRGLPARALLAELDVRYLGSLEFRLLGLEERLLWNVNTPRDYQILITGA